MFSDLVTSRYSVRHYADKKVSKEKLERILEVGRLSPTAANLQPQKIYVLKSNEAMQKARETTRMLYNAPLALLVCYDNTLSWKGKAFGELDYDGGEVDVAIVTTTMMMKATELGLGSLWVRGFSAQKVSEVFGLPAHIHPVCYLLLGYPSDISMPNNNHEERKECNETVCVL